MPGLFGKALIHAKQSGNTYLYAKYQSPVVQYAAGDFILKVLTDAKACKCETIRDFYNMWCLKNACMGVYMNISCEYCANYTYDEDDDEYYCDVSLDEDEFMRLLESNFKACPYYRSGDEYSVVRHQM